MRLLRLKSGRFPELDWLRGLAVMAMIVYHAVVDWYFFFGRQLPFSIFGPGWRIGSYLIAGTFLVLVGISLYIKRVRQNLVSTKSVTSPPWWQSSVQHGLIIFAWGFVITLTTALFIPEWVIWFGILQLIGASIILSLPFLLMKRVLWLGIAIIAAGVIINHLPISANSLVLLPFGFHPQSIQSFDYFPLLPWWGVVLIGVGIGQRWYAGGQRRWHFSGRFSSIVNDHFSLPVIWVGQHALLLYLIHQPILLLLFYLLLR